MNRHQVEETIKRARSEKWEYPKLFNALKACGVASYDVDVATHHIVYHGGGQSFTDAPQEFHPLAVSSHFSAGKFKEALAKHQAEKTPYLEFLKDIAAAGIHAYTVDMATRTIAYRGRKSGEEILEKVP